MKSLKVDSVTHNQSIIHSREHSFLHLLFMSYTCYRDTKGSEAQNQFYCNLFVHCHCAVHAKLCLGLQSEVKIFIQGYLIGYGATDKGYDFNSFV